MIPGGTTGPSPGNRCGEYAENSRYPSQLRSVCPGSDVTLTVPASSCLKGQFDLLGPHSESSP